MGKLQLFSWLCLQDLEWMDGTIDGCLTRGAAPPVRAAVGSSCEGVLGLVIGDGDWDRTLTSVVV